ncbi:MAG TPA: response regulator, partial [Polyangiales bacterium]
MSQGLREAGYAVDVANDGDAGLAFARTNPYDTIVLDLMLPKLDGVSVLRAVRAESATPVLILTARDAVEARVQGLDLGAD